MTARYLPTSSLHVRLFYTSCNTVTQPPPQHIRIIACIFLGPSNPSFFFSFPCVYLSPEKRPPVLVEPSINADSVTSATTKTQHTKKKKKLSVVLLARARDSSSGEASKVERSGREGRKPRPCRDSHQVQSRNRYRSHDKG